MGGLRRITQMLNTIIIIFAFVVVPILTIVIEARERERGKKIYK